MDNFYTNKIKKHEPLTNVIANAGLPRFHRNGLCWLKRLKSLHIFTFFVFLNIGLIAQPAKTVLQFNQLGFLKSDSTVGNFDGGMSQFIVDLTDYSIEQKSQEIRLSGKIFDKSTRESLCNIYAFIGKTDSKTRKLKTIKKYKIDCSGNFDLSLNLATNDNLYFWIIGYSLLECKVDKTKIK